MEQSNVDQECSAAAQVSVNVENNKSTTKNVRLNLVDVRIRAKSQSYVQACKGSTYACKDTKYIIGEHNPALLTKLKQASKE